MIIFIIYTIVSLITALILFFIDDEYTIKSFFGCLLFGFWPLMNLYFLISLLVLLITKLISN